MRITGSTWISPARIRWEHRQAGATEVLIGSANRWALMHELRGAAEPELPELLGRLSPVDLVLVEGFKRGAHRKIEVHRVANGKPLLHPEDPTIVAVASDGPVSGGAAACWAGRYGRRWPRLVLAHAEAPALMAQLSDDCFAFGGKLQTVDAALALIAARVGCARGRWRRWRCARRMGGCWRRIWSAPVDLPPFANSAVDGYAVRLGDLAGGDVLPVSGRLAAGAAGDAAGRGRRSGSSPAPRCRQGRIRCSCRRMWRSRRAGCGCRRACGRGANTRPAGEDVARGGGRWRAGSRLRPQDVALAAALGVETLAVRRRVRVALFSTGDELVEPGAAPGPAQRHDSNRVLLAMMAARAGAEVTDLGILPDQAGADRGGAAGCGGGA